MVCTDCDVQRVYITDSHAYRRPLLMNVKLRNPDVGSVIRETDLGMLQRAPGNH
jgi:hypothetical protein